MRGRTRLLFAVLALLIGVVSALIVVLSWDPRESGPSQPVEHPPYASGTPCSSCKAPLHDYVHEAPYLGSCDRCHGLSSWRAVAYSHRDPQFDVGFHGVVGCPFCHTDRRPSPAPECRTCHRSEHRFTDGCPKCHQVTAWRLSRPLPLEHVGLVNGHATLVCFDCHEGVASFARPKPCVECHGVKHGGLAECGDCHDPRLNWVPKRNFDHAAFFPLDGRHAELDCTTCHPRGEFAAARPVCSSCHGSRHGGLTACASCHTTEGFVPSTFRHASRWALTGAHARLACATCHPSRLFARVIGSPGACVNCHEAQHGGLTACASCHTTEGFEPSTFRHASRWALTGAHARLACATCHPSRLFARVIGSPSACVNCHGVAHGGQTTCDACHTTTAFIPTKAIVHPEPIVLGLQHASRSCRLCHPTLAFSEPTMPCADCHTAPHVEPTDCLRCHRPTLWSELHFTHHDIGHHTDKPIEDACLYCHTTGNYGVYVCDQCHYPF